MALSPYFFVDSSEAVTPTGVDLIGINTTTTRRVLCIMANNLREAAQILQTYCHRRLLENFALLSLTSVTYNSDGNGFYLNNVTGFRTISSTLWKGKIVQVTGGTGWTSTHYLTIKATPAPTADRVYLEAGSPQLTAGAADIACNIPGGHAVAAINWTDPPSGTTGIGNELATVAGHPLVALDGHTALGVGFSKGADYPGNMPGPAMMIRIVAA